MGYKNFEYKKTPEDVVILTMKNFTFNQEFIREFDQILNEISKMEGNLALVTTSSNPKIYSAGLNFKVFDQHYDDVYNFICEFCRLLGKIFDLNLMKRDSIILIKIMTSENL